MVDALCTNQEVYKIWWQGLPCNASRGMYDHKKKHFLHLNPITGWLWNYVARRGGGIMAQVFFRRHNFAKRLPSTQNLLLDKYFDL